jgi:hypothetical protein
VGSRRFKTFVVERKIKTEFDSPTAMLQPTGVMSMREWVSPDLLIPVAWEQQNGSYMEYSGRLSTVPR